MSINSATPPVRHTVPLSFTLHWNLTVLPSLHISVTTVSPGNTCEEKRARMERRRAASDAAKARKMCLPAIPNEHRPCRMGLSKPPIAAIAGSACSGFTSPLRRYSSAWFGRVLYSEVTSAAREGTAHSSALGPLHTRIHALTHTALISKRKGEAGPHLSPPNPPMPRMNTEERENATSAPDSFTEVTSN